MQQQQQQQGRPLDRAVVRGDYGGGGGREAEGRREDRPEGHRGRKAVAFESIDEEGEDEEDDRRRPNVRLSLEMICCCFSIVLSC